MDAPFQPKLREQHVEQAEQVGDSGAVGYQRIHIGGAVFQLFPCAGKETSSQPEYDGSREQPHNKIGVRHIHKEHADNHNGHGQDDGPCGAEFQRAIFFVVRLLHFIRCILILFNQQVVSGILHGLLQGFGRAILGVIFHSCRCRSIIYGCFSDAGLAVQRLFHSCGA